MCGVADFFKKNCQPPELADIPQQLLGLFLDLQDGE